MLVRRVVGGPQPLEQLCQRYAGLRLFQPSAKRIPFEVSDARDGRRRRRHHDQPLTIRLEREGAGLYVGSLRTLKRRMAAWQVAHAEQVMGQQMGAIQEQEHSNSTKEETTVQMPTRAVTEEMSQRADQLKQHRGRQLAVAHVADSVGGSSRDGASQQRKRMHM